MKFKSQSTENNNSASTIGCTKTKPVQVFIFHYQVMAFQMLDNLVKNLTVLYSLPSGNTNFFIPLRPQDAENRNIKTLSCWW